MKIKFHKLVGAGNDFIFVNDSELSSISDLAKFAIKICDRNFGIGADGLAVIKNSATLSNHTTFTWDFYNNDGSRAEMCGNAARCAVVYNKMINDADTCVFQTEIGMINGCLIENGASVTWEIKNPTLKEQTISLDYGKSFAGWSIDTGVPHFVVFDEPQGTVNGRDCLTLQTHSSFGERNTNVTILTRRDQGPHNTKSFERGVKKFTLACGTGVIACAAVLKSLTSTTVHELQTPGGLLSVEFHDDNTVSLEGPAAMVFQGTY